MGPESAVGIFYKHINEKFRLWEKRNNKKASVEAKGCGKPRFISSKNISKEGQQDCCE